jgi:hypothetical protein
LLVCITDYYEEQGEITKLLHALSGSKHEVIVFHLMGENEMELNYKGYSTLEDLESGKTMPINGEQNTKQYKERLQQHLEGIKKSLLDKNIFYELITMNEPIDKALIRFLKHRNKPTR